VSLAEKLDTLVGLFGAGEKPTGSRDPYGLRRGAHGVIRILVDLQVLTGLTVRPTLNELLGLAAQGYPHLADLSRWRGEDIDELSRFLVERLHHVLETRGADRRNVRAATTEFEGLRPAEVAAKVDALGAFAASAQFTQLAKAFKRVKNIADELKEQRPADLTALAETLREPAERELLEGLKTRIPLVDEAAGQQNYRAALAHLSELGPAVDRFFTDVLVMTDDLPLRTARLSLMAHLRNAVRRIGDVSEVVAVDK
jgi:glycyl-tRNA synthetase beta chain